MMRQLRRMAVWLALTAVLAFGAPVAAQQAIALEVGESFTHPHSGIVVPATLGGQPRTAAAAYAPDLLDLGINFESANRGEVLSFYIYRNTNGNVPLWFAQAQSVIEGRDVYDDPELVLGPLAFVPPGQPAASGLLAIYEPGRRSGSRTTGVALFAIGEWYVKLRASSNTRTADGLLHWMEGAMAELAVPASSAAAVAPVADCERRLRFRGRARDAQGDPADTMMGSILSGMLGGIIQERQADAAPVRWCRDAQIALGQTVYRANGSEAGYLLALGDNGNAVQVQSELRLEGVSPERDDDDARFTVMLMTAARNTNFVSQDRLPSPERVIELIDANRVTSSQNTWGEDRSVEISSGALSK